MHYRDPTSDGDGTALVLLCTVLFQERAGTALTCKINNAWEKRIMDTIRGVDGWTRYRVARAALRYGHHNLAADILKRLSEEAPSESAQRWLTALHRAAAADATLIKEVRLALYTTPIIRSAVDNNTNKKARHSPVLIEKSDQNPITQIAGLQKSRQPQPNLVHKIKKNPESEL
ncbi:unnamed protein product [Diatraea saccharalis]|uniref:Uncharacterized protein n=1 Tax=Diatraea saccharalis TaxID=40085 RepID=A0A9N9WDX8_9NEOP|nr:unnamed protein product [Diatraea saccharalis]